MGRDYVPKDGVPMSPAQQQELERRKAVRPLRFMLLLSMQRLFGTALG
jgi:hypothetical protein